MATAAYSAACEEAAIFVTTMVIKREFGFNISLTFHIFHATFRYNIPNDAKLQKEYNALCFEFIYITALKLQRIK